MSLLYPSVTRQTRSKYMFCTTTEDPAIPTMCKNMRGSIVIFLKILEAVGGCSSEEDGTLTGRIPFWKMESSSSEEDEEDVNESRWLVGVLVGCRKSTGCPFWVRGMSNGSSILLFEIFILEGTKERKLVLRNYVTFSWTTLSHCWTLDYVCN